MDELGGAGLLADPGAEAAGDGLAVALAAGGFDGVVEAVENEQVAVGVVHSREGGDALDVEERGHGVHFVVIEFVPGGVPAGVVLFDAVLEFKGAEVVADAVDAGHEGEVGAGDGEDERVVGGVALEVVGDVVVDLRGGADKGVLGMADEAEGLTGVGEGDGEEQNCGGWVGEGEGSPRGRTDEEEALEDERDQEGEGDGDNQVITGLEVVVVREEGVVAGGPEDEGGDKGACAELAEVNAGGQGGEEGERVEDGAHPHAVFNGVDEDGEHVFAGDAGVGVSAEEVTVVQEEVGADEDEKVGEPEGEGEGGGGESDGEEDAETVAGSREEHPSDGGYEEEGGGLGEDHGGKERAKEEDGSQIAAHGGEDLVAVGGGGGETGGVGEASGEERKEGEEDYQGLENGETGEDEAKGTGGEHEDGGRGGERKRVLRGAAATEEEPGADEDSGENCDGEGSGGDEGDASEVEEERFKKGPDGERSSGVEVAGDVPVAELEVADGGVAVPAFVGVFGPVHPGGVVGKVGGEVDGMKDEEEGRSDQHRGVEGTAKRFGQGWHA